MNHTPLPKEELDLFKQLKDLHVIFDVGARTDTDYLELWPESEHHLFEPNPLFVKELKEKIGDRPNVHINEFGLGDREHMRGYQESRQSFVGSNSCPEDATIDFNLPVKTLDGYIREHDIKQIDFLKMDTEGSEIKILLGGASWLHIMKFIQYEHWGAINDRMIKAILADFDCLDVGYRNVFCMSKSLVEPKERRRLKGYIKRNKLDQLV